MSTQTDTRPLLLPLLVRGDAVQAGDFYRFADRGLLEVVDTAVWSNDGLPAQTQLCYGLGADDYAIVNAEAEVEIYRAPSESEWWEYLSSEYGIERWPNG